MEAQPHAPISDNRPFAECHGSVPFVRKETLQILKGASTSRKLKNPIQVSMIVHDTPVAVHSLHGQRNEYTLSKNQIGSAPLSSSNFNDPWFGIATTVRRRTVEATQRSILVSDIVRSLLLSPTLSCLRGISNGEKRSLAEIF